MLYFYGVESEVRIIQCGVPQSSRHGPLLSILNMNDICNVLDVFFAIMYDLHSLIASPNNALKDVCSWFKSNKLFFNPIRSGLFQTVNDPGGGGL